MDILHFPSVKSRMSIRLSIESSNGKRRRMRVEVERTAGDDDQSLILKASAEFRPLHGFGDRVAAIYVTSK